MSNVIKIDQHWITALCHDKKEGLQKIRSNARLLITHGKLAGHLAFDEFSDRTFWLKSPPNISGFPAPLAGEEFSDVDHVDYVQNFLAKHELQFPCVFPDTMLYTACMSAARMNRVNPLRSYLRGLTWDRKPRLGTMMADLFGAQHSRYVSKIAIWWMVSAVARVIQPGCQADYMLILQGAQGLRKSTALQTLCGAEYFIDKIGNVEGKDAAIALVGKWIIEEGELDSMVRSELTAFKGFVTRKVDDYRPPYGRGNIKRPRTCVFAATTNGEKIFTDPTGNRRYWPVTCGAEIKVEQIEKLRDQLWGEAVSLFEGGEQWHPTKEMVQEVQDQQEERYDADVWENQIASIIDTWESASSKVDFTVGEVLNSIGVQPAQQTRQMSTRVGISLTRLGYTSDGRRLIGGKKFAVYKLKDRLPMREPGEDDV